MAATYDSLHRQCRTLESLFDTKLTSYARLAATISRSGAEEHDLEAGPSWREAESEVGDLLEKVRAIYAPRLLAPNANRSLR
jgi:Golgi SNAP receptor complex protein 1